MLNITNLKKSFDGVFEPVLNGINLSLKKGDFCTIIGANGSGKSTLLKTISGEYPLTSGTIKIYGKIARVVQDVNQGTIPAMSVVENVMLSQITSPKLRFYRRKRDTIIDMLRSLNIGIEKFADQKLRALSGGQRQVIATFMALNSGSQLLLLDEHTSALDPKMQKFLMEYTAKSIRQMNLTAMMITHNMSDALKYGNRLIMLHKGRIVADWQGKEKNLLSIDDLLEMFRKFEN